MSKRSITMYEIAHAKTMLKKYRDLMSPWTINSLEKVAEGNKKSHSRKSAERFEKLRKEF